MKWLWLVGAIVVWLLSAACITGTLRECGAGKGKARKPDFWAGVVFHGGTALAALWMLMKALK